VFNHVPYRGHELRSVLPDAFPVEPEHLARQNAFRTRKQACVNGQCFADAVDVFLLITARWRTEH
jgi:hypothetical protein